MTLVMAAFTVLVCTFLAYADGQPVAQVPPVVVSSGPISAGEYVSPGAYVASVAPNFNGAMANRLEKALAQVPGLKSVNASSTDSTLRFTITDGAKVRVADLQATVAKTDAGAVMTTPVLTHSMTPKPGL